MKIFSKLLLICLLATSRLSFAIFDGARDHIRDFFTEAVITAKFLFDSNAIVEVDEENYPELDQMITDLARKADIEKPILFLITKKYPGFLDKANTGAVGDKKSSAIFVGSWIVNTMSKQELEGVLAHEVTHIAKNHVLKRLAAAVGGLAVTVGLAALFGRLVNIDRTRVACYVGYPDVSQEIRVISHERLGFVSAFIVLVIPYLISLTYYARLQEKEADLGAVDLTGHKKIARSLEKLGAICKKYLPYTTWARSQWVNRIFASHPQTKDRVKYIENYIPAQSVSPEVAAA